MASQVNFTVRDHSDEYSSMQLNIPPIDETNWLSVDAQVGALQTAVAALTTGNIARKSLVAYTEPVDDTRPANPYAQRELGLRLFYQDNVTSKKYHVTVPSPDLIVVAAGGTDDIDLTLSAVAAVVSAIEALAVSPEGNAITIYAGKIVGRRS